MAARRPAPPRGDFDVDDELQQLLKEQEDFMRQRQRPAAKITRVGPAAAPHAPAPEPTESETPDDGPQVVGAVRERDVGKRSHAPRATSGGFPAVRRRGESLFGRRQRQAASEPPASDASKLSGMGRIVERAPAVTSAQSVGAARSDVVSEKDWEGIDETNRAALAAMSTADIRAAQQELASMLDPELLAKLKNRGQKKASAKPKPATRPGKREDVVAATKKLAAAGIDLSKIETEEQLFEEAKRLPAEERAKHEWMQPVSAQGSETNEPAASKPSARSKRHPLRQNQSKKPGSTASGERFDFNGDVVTLDTSVPVHSGLYHHGDEPEAAGYTMDELLHLARSSVASQRVMALTTVAKVLHKRQQQRKRGGAVVPAVLPAELPVALRMTLDDQNYTALSASIAALYVFLCGAEAVSEDDTFDAARGTIVGTPKIHIHVDEGTTRDELLHEVIYIDTGESEEDGSKIGDQELSSLDPIQGLLKMTIVTRVCYILTTIQLPDVDATAKLLDILIRIGAHSPRSAQAVAADRKLMKALQTKFLESERVLMLQTEPAEEFAQAAAFTHKTLALVRVLCQGSRAVASLFMESGIIQTTKGFLGLRIDQTTDQGALEAIQLECLRIWRVLLGYGLDFHSFAYMYPLLCGFDAVDLVHDKSNEPSGVERWSDRCLAAIFSALEAFAGLGTIHEAQHYFSQFGFFIQLAKDEITRRLADQVGSNGSRIVEAALRFLTSCSKLAGKFHLDRAPFISTFKVLESGLSAPRLRVQVLETERGRDLFVAAASFGAQALSSDLVNDDEDEDEVRKQFFLKTKPLFSSLVASTTSAHDTLTTCELLLVANGLYLLANHHDDAFIRSIYAGALSVVQDLKPGRQFWIHSLFTEVLFNPLVLQKTGFFPDLNDAIVMGRVLTPIYQALVNSTKEQEEHSRSLFALGTNPKQKQTCHLVDPQDEQEFISSNLPLPFFWMFCPFSRLEYSSSPSGNDAKQTPRSASTLGPSHAESEEMKVIVSAACRYIDQLEAIVRAVRSSSSEQSELGDEDKLFHLMHVFFAGTDVLFDEYVDLALSKLLQKYALSVLTNANPTALYDGLLRNLRQFESIEAGETREAPSSSTDAPSSSTDAPTSFTTETETVMTFVERLVNEFTSNSFGNAHFSRLVTLFLLHDFPIEIRKWVWKELAASNLLHRLEPFTGSQARDATGQRATRDAKRSDETLIRAMKNSIATRRSGVVSQERGPFAYWLAIHHTVAYVFGNEENVAELSFSRQKLLQDLVADASPVVWRHLLSYDTSSFSPGVIGETRQPRVDRVLLHAGFSDAQAEAFRVAL